MRAKATKSQLYQTSKTTFCAYDRKKFDDGNDGCNDNYDDNYGNFDDDYDKNDSKTCNYCV